MVQGDAAGCVPGDPFHPGQKLWTLVEDDNVSGKASYPLSPSSDHVMCSSSVDLAAVGNAANRTNATRRCHLLVAGSD
jgi:hypothetical protein